MKYSIGVLRRELREIEAQVESVSDRITNYKLVAKRRRKELVNNKFEQPVRRYWTKTIKALSQTLRKNKQKLNDLTIAIETLEKPKA